jgi:hypothetical protein
MSVYMYKSRHIVLHPKPYSQMKLQMKREALEKLNRRASEMVPASGESIGTVEAGNHDPEWSRSWKVL